MNKTQIRSYFINDKGDLCVTGYRHGDRVDLSEHYADEPHPKRSELRKECCIDVFRYDDGNLCWVATPNGNDVPAAMTLQLLLRVFDDDVDANDGEPRAF